MIYNTLKTELPSEFKKIVFHDRINEFFLAHPIMQIYIVIIRSIIRIIYTLIRNITVFSLKKG